MIYALVASVLPIWLLLQPRDYLNSYQLYIGMALLYSLWQFLTPAEGPVSWPLVVTGSAILFLDLWLILEAALSLNRLRTERRAALTLAEGA